jgi:predicted methyltransferase
MLFRKISSFCRIILIAYLAIGAFGLVAHAAELDAAELHALVDGAQRTAKNSARDPYRHPYEVLSFFGIADDATVVEIDPGGAGYWTEILAPYLKERGHYIAANGPKDSPSEEVQRGNAAFAAKVAGDPSNYAKVETAAFDPGGKGLTTQGDADFVLTFRNIHNWMKDGTAEAAFAAFFKTLKPGGVLGVEEHRGRNDQPQDPKALSGYVRQDYAIKLAEAAGFKLVAVSEVNANPKDTKDYPEGVWTLPPTYRLKDKDHEKYAAIGESDRFVLKFIKPKAQ